MVKGLEKRKRLIPVKGIDNINKVIKEPEPKFLWNGILEGSKGIITGVAKTGKTTLAENLAISLSVGKEELLGFKLEGKPRRVAYLNLEENYRIFGRRNRKQIASLSSDEKKLFNKNYLSIPENFPEFLITDEDWLTVREYVIDSKAEVVFLDSLTHMFEGEIEKSFSAHKFIKKFRETFKGLNVTIVVVHHNTKGNDGPITQDNIAGSRVILQEFEFAIGLANIPTNNGGNYMCTLYNKYTEKDDTKAVIYKLKEDGWIEILGVANKFNLYKNTYDGRKNTSNKDVVYEFIESQTSQTSQTITTSELMDKFIYNEDPVMSKDTLHKSLNKLNQDDSIKKVKNGVYKLNKVANDE